MTFFSASDFDLDGITTDNYAELVANAANTKLRRYANVVYGNVDPMVLTSWMSSFEGMYLGTYTHRALLVCIEKIERKHCEHEVSSSDITLVSNGNVKYRCRFCDVYLKPTGWEVVNDQAE